MATHTRDADCQICGPCQSEPPEYDDCGCCECAEREHDRIEMDVESGSISEDQAYDAHTLLDIQRG